MLDGALVDFWVPSSSNSVCSHNQTSGNEAYEKHFHNSSFLMAVIFHDRRVHLVSPPVITFYGGTSKVKFSSLSLKPLRNLSRE
jgi:hypothetical protein